MQKPKPTRRLGVLYDKITGEIISAIGAKNLEDQAHGEYLVLEGAGTPQQHYIDISVQPTIELRLTGHLTANKPHLFNDGVDTVSIICPDPCFLKINADAALYVEGGQYNFSTNRRGIHVINIVGRYTAPEIVLRAYTEVEAREKINAALNSQWQDELSAGVSINTGKEEITIDTDINSRVFLSEVAARADRGKVLTQKIKTKDNQIKEISKKNIEDIDDAVAAMVADKFDKAQAKKTELAQITDIDDILNYDVKGGWQ